MTNPNNIIETSLSANETSSGETLKTLKENVFEYARLRLADGMIDISLEPKHFENCLQRAIDVYRTRSSNAFEESYSYLTLQNNVQEYTLPTEITEIRQIYRRTIGSSSNAEGTEFEPFEAGYLNCYLLTAGGVGGLLTYELYTGYQQLVAKMFGGFINFTFNTVTKKLKIIRRPQGSGEIVLLWTYNLRPLIYLLSDYRCQTWLKEYTYSLCKYTEGEARSKFATIVGPTGGSQLNGEALKTEAKEEMVKAELDLRNYVDGGSPLYWSLG